MRLKHYIAMAIFLLGSLSILGISAFYYQTQRETIIASARAKSEFSAEAVAEHLTTHIEERINIARALGNVPLLHEALRKSNASFDTMTEEERTEEITRLNRRWRRAKEAEADFAQVYINNPAAHYLTQHVEAFPGRYGAIFLTNRYGTMVATTKKFTSFAHAHKYWWQTSYAGGRGKPFLDDLGYIRKLDAVVLGVVVPILDCGEVVGTLRSNTLVQERFAHIVDEFNTANSGEMRIVRSNGRVLYVGGERPDSGEVCDSIMTLLGAADTTNSVIADCDGRAVLVAKSTIRGINPENQFSFGVGRKKNRPELGDAGQHWNIVIERDMDEVLAPLHARMRELALVVGAIWLLVGLVSYIAASHISGPLNALMAVAERIGEGKLDARADVSRIREIGALGQSINRMAEHLGDTLVSRDALQESEQRLALATQAAEIGIWDLDAVNNRLTWDKQMFSVYGLGETGDTLGIEVWEGALHPDDKETARKKFESALQHDSEFDSEFRIVWPDGTIHDIQAKAMIIRNAEGEPVRMIGTNRDVTDEKRLQERLGQIDKMDAIGQLAGGVAHDFNNQLAGVMGYADMLRQRLDDPVLRKYVNNILRGARRSADLTQKLLAFSRQGQYQVVAINMHNVIREIADIVLHAHDKGIRVEQALNAPLSLVRGDPGLVQNAFLNLATNAVEAMSESGTLTFETSVTELDELMAAAMPGEVTPGTYLQVNVCDTGSGIAEENLSRIFEPFFTTKAVGEGSGMGLAAAFGTVEKMRGCITVASKPGQGTAFSVYLPLEPASSEPQSEMESTDTAVIQPGREAKVLVVDDEEMLRDVATDMLTALDYTVEAFDCGEAAVAYFRANSADIDLVVLDMLMPGMGGPETFRAMKAVKPDVRVILSSGFSKTGKAEALLEEGALAFVQKPFEMAELSAKVAEALGCG